MKDEDAELQQEDSWDFQRAVKRPGRKAGRTVVSVAFSRQDFERVAQRAEYLGLKTSEFIRKAALESVDVVPPRRPPSIFLSTGWGAIVVSEELPSVTIASWTAETQPKELITG